MSMQLCPKCKRVDMTWSMDDQDKTWWNCRCGFVAEEDERKERTCTSCNKDKSCIWLMHDGINYYWCVSCGTKTEAA